MKPAGKTGATDRRAQVAEVVAATRAVYRDLSARPIERDCIGRTECCHFKLTGRTPFLTKAEAIVAAKALRGSANAAELATTGSSLRSPVTGVIKQRTELGLRN